MIIGLFAVGITVHYDLPLIVKGVAMVAFMIKTFEWLVEV